MNNAFEMLCLAKLPSYLSCSNFFFRSAGKQITAFAFLTAIGTDEIEIVWQE